MNNKGLLLYCLTNKPEDYISHVKGLDEENFLYLVEYEGTYGVVSDIDLDEFGEENMKEKSEDIVWLTDKAMKFMNIINSINTAATVIPMKFLTIFNTADRIIEVIKENYDAFQHNFARLNNKEEMGIKIYCNDKIFKETSMGEEIKKFEESLIGKPKGSAFFLRKKFDSELNDKAQQKLCDFANSIIEASSPFYEEMQSNKLVAKEITGVQEKMILNCAFLVDTKKKEDFVNYFSDSKENYKAKGFIINITGPWPPYSFSNL